MIKELKKVVVVSSNIDGVVKDPSKTHMTGRDLVGVFKAINLLGNAQGFNHGGPGGAFSFEPTEGLWHYITFIVRDTRGLIALMSSQVIRDDKIVLTISFDEYRRALTEWEVILENKHSSLGQDLDAVQAELLQVKDIIKQLEEADLL